MADDARVPLPHISEYTGFENAQDLAPLVIVEGFLSSTAPFLWGRFEDHLNARREELGKAGRRRVIFTSVGPVSSLHDRACELYYSLRGGTVQYGLQHSLEAGHKPFGRSHEHGLYPAWSPSHPLHFIGHSMGGPTITTMLTLMREGFFDEDAKQRGLPLPSLDDSLVASVTTVSAPFRGTGVVYDMGEKTDAAPAVRPLSFGNMVTKAVYALEYLSPLIPDFLRPDLHAESRSLSFLEQTPSQFLHILLSGSGGDDWAQSEDATPFDCTFDAASRRDERFWNTMTTAKPPGGLGATKGRTWYRTYSACMTSAVSKSDIETGGAPKGGNHAPPDWTQAFDSGPLYFSATSLGKFDYASLLPQPAFPIAFEGHREAAQDRPMPNPYPYSPFSLAPSQSRSIAMSPSDDDNPVVDPVADLHAHMMTPLSIINSPNTLPSIPSSPSLLSPPPRPFTLSFAARPGTLPLDALPEEYFANDGVVPVFSQWHPGPCWEGARCIHHNRDASLGRPDVYTPDIFLREREEDWDDYVLVPPFDPPLPVQFAPHPITGGMRASSTLSSSNSNSHRRSTLPRIQTKTRESRLRELSAPNIFHVYPLPASSPEASNPELHHHLLIMPLWTGTDRQRAFWCEVGAWLEEVDEARALLGES